MDDLQRILAHIGIGEAKARYCRTLDTKDWDGYGDVFTADATMDTRPSGGALTQGREAIVAIVRAAVERAQTAHQVHAPEISFLSDDEAEVIWAMQDRVEWDAERAGRLGYAGHSGFGHYHERYRREGDGLWRIAYQTLTRLRMDMH